jgi:hypothetical protein
MDRGRGSRAKNNFGDEAMITRQIGRIARVAIATAIFAVPVQAQLPAAGDLLTKYRAAMGGDDVIKKHTSMHIVAEFEMPAQGVKGNVEIWSAVPDKFLSVVEIPQLGSVKQGFDGTTGWATNPMIGAQLLTGKELAMAKEQADMHSILHPEKFAKSRETVEKTTFDGKDAYKVKVTPIEGDEFFEFYDATSGLMIGSIRKNESPMGVIEMTTAVTDYQVVDGQQVAMKMKQSVSGMEQIITIKKVEFIPVDATVFALPAEIKALTGK